MLFVTFGIEASLDAIKTNRLLASAAVRPVAIVGPGLDFTDKREGYDFYPPQTLQPFAVIDSLKRLGLAGGDLRVTTLDLSPRINCHVTTARARRRGVRAAASTRHVLSPWELEVGSWAL